MPSTLPGRHRVSRRARLLDAWSGGPGVDAVATALVLAASRRSVSALSHDRPIRLGRGTCALVADTRTA